MILALMLQATVAGSLPAVPVAPAPPASAAPSPISANPAPPPAPPPAAPASSPFPAQTPSSADGAAPLLGYLTAGQLAERCEQSTAASVSYCYAYIAAVYDTMRAYEVWLNQREFCMPATIAQNELKQRFLTYLSAYPSNRTGLASSVVAVALKTSAPCPVPEPPAAPTTPGPAQTGKAAETKTGKR